MVKGFERGNAVLGGSGLRALRHYIGDSDELEAFNTPNGIEMVRTDPAASRNGDS